MLFLSKITILHILNYFGDYTTKKKIVSRDVTKFNPIIFGWWSFYTVYIARSYNGQLYWPFEGIPRRASKGKYVDFRGGFYGLPTLSHYCEGENHVKPCEGRLKTSIQIISYHFKINNFRLLSRGCGENLWPLLS